jgi:hypothetical protein
MLPLEYIAGLIDADGSISISVSKNRYTNKRGESAPQFAFVVNLRLLQEFRPLLEEVQETLRAGKIYDHKAYSATSTAMSSWQTTTHDDAMRVCEKLLPLLHIKKKEARLMIEALAAWRAFGSKNRTVEVKDFVLDIASQMNNHQQKATRKLRYDEQ